MAWWVFVLVWIGTTIAQWGLTQLMRKDPARPKASGLGDFQVPTVDAARAIPVACGTVLLKGPNVLWYGDLTTQAIKSGGTTTGYRYFLGMQLALCQGLVDVLRDIWWDERPLGAVITTVGDHKRATIAPFKSFLFIPVHGDDPDGAVDVFLGTSSQNPSDYLEAALGTDLPAYRTLAYAVFRHIYVGTSAYLKNFAFEVSLYPNTLGLTGSKHIIATYDANPVCHLYDILINQDWGCERPSGEIDLASFQAAGNAIYAEGLGLSMNHDSQADGDAIIEEILRHIDATIYKDPATGLITIRLIRADFDPNTIPILDESMIASLELSRPSWSELSNTAQVRYASRADQYTQRVAEQQNLAAVQIQGTRVVETMDFMGASRAEVANLIAAREVKAGSYPLARATIKVNRQAWALTPGAPFKVNYAPLGIAGLVMRVVKPSYGELEDPEITLEAIQDIFSLETAAFSPPPASGWVNPVGAPMAVSQQRLIEFPYHLVGSEARLAGACAARGQGAAQGYEVWSDRAGGTAYILTNTVTGFTPSAQLVGAYALNTAATDTTGFIVDGGVDLSLLLPCTETELLAGKNLALIDDEILSFRDVVDNGDGTWTISRVMRGVLDTVAAAHADNARVWFIGPTALGLVDPSMYPADVTVAAKLLPFNARGVLPIASATATSVTTASRAPRPYPPGNVKVAGTTYPATVTAGVDAVVSWNHRHRVHQYFDHRVVAQDAGDYFVAPEGDYTIEVRVGGTLKRTVTALTGTSWTWTAAFQSADAATAGASVSIRVIPVNGAVVGTYQERLFTMA
jgi:hypothetical protein